MPNKNNVTVSAKVPKEYGSRLKEIAESKGISLGELIRESISAYMELNTVCEWSGKSPVDLCKKVGQMFLDNEIKLD